MLIILNRFSYNHQYTNTLTPVENDSLASVSLENMLAGKYAY